MHGVGCLRTSRAPWRFTRMADERTWASFKGKHSSVESQAGLPLDSNGQQFIKGSETKKVSHAMPFDAEMAPRTLEEFHHLGQIKEKMLRQLTVRKSELQKSNTLINWDEEDRWQRFNKAAKCYRHVSLN